MNPQVCSSSAPVGRLGTTVTAAVFGAAARRGDAPAIVDIGGGEVVGYRRLGLTVSRGGAHLSRRGLSAGQVAAVHAEGVAAYLAGVHMVIAAGAVAAAAPSAAGIAGLTVGLTALDARLLITTPAIAEVALAATECSRVRQVMAFGEVPGATDLTALIDSPPPDDLPAAAVDPAGDVLAGFGTGERLTHAGLLARMRAADEAAAIRVSDVVLVTRPMDGGIALTAALSLALMRGCLIVAAPGVPEAEAAGVAHDYGATVRLGPAGVARVSGG
ncbi:AMP-binding protein [Bailinhaonella thermotolerans]|nr:AMP-binding protein [Bailinhaonella thermotolerans]